MSDRDCDAAVDVFMLSFIVGKFYGKFHEFFSPRSQLQTITCSNTEKSIN